MLFSLNRALFLSSLCFLIFAASLTQAVPTVEPEAEVDGSGRDCPVSMLQLGSSVKGKQRRDEMAKVSTVHQIRRQDSLAPEDGVACTSDFGMFGLEPLTSTQMVPREVNQKPQDFSSYQDISLNFTVTDNVWSPGATHKLWVLPAQHLAMCLISKVASTDWMTILAKIYVGNASANVVAGSFSAGSPPMAAASTMDAVFSDPTATRIVFTREPLDRFRSAFMDKCNSSSATMLCPMSPAGSDGRTLSMKDAVEWMLMQDPAQLEQHWLLQSEHCELRSRVTEYTVVGRYSKEILSKDAACIMEAAGVADFNNLGPENGNAPYWSAEETTISTGGSTDLEEDKLMQTLFTPEAARKLIKHLWQDYDTFNYPVEPSWLAGATGELYEQPIISL